MQLPGDNDQVARCSRREAVIPQILAPNNSLFLWTGGAPKGGGPGAANTKDTHP